MQPKDLESPLISSPLHLHGVGNKEEGGMHDGEGGKRDGEGGKGDGEGGMGDALGEELGDLQEANCDLRKQLEVAFR